MQYYVTPYGALYKLSVFLSVTANKIFKKIATNKVFMYKVIKKRVKRNKALFVYF